MSNVSCGPAALTLVLAWQGLAWQGTLAVRQKIGPATLYMHRDDDKIALSRFVRLEITVAGDANSLEIQPLASATLEPSWRIIAQHAVAADPVRSRLWAQRIEAEPLHPGELTLQLPPLRYRAGNGPWRQVEWQPIHVNVRTVASADVKDLRDISAIELLPDQEDRAGWADWIIPAAGGTMLLVLVVTAWRWRERRRAGLLSPEQLAMRDLERIAALNLARNGRADRFHVLLHDAIRRYLRRRYQIAGRARTSAELRGQLESAPLAAGQRDMLAGFFERCERGKFAGTTPSVEECQETAELARRIVTFSLPVTDAGATK